MATPPDIRDSRFGSITGIDLLAPVILNNNPLDIKAIGSQPAGSVWEKWRYFFGFINKYIDKKDASLNTEEGKKKITLKLINDFNTNKDTSAWAAFGTSNPYRGSNNPITQEDIKAIQKFTQKTDLRVIVDGWLGTQTLQMNYPSPNSIIDINVGKTPDPEKFYPVIWGDKRYVIKVKDYIDSTKTNLKPYPLYLNQYDPNRHNDKFIGDPNNSQKWIILGNPVLPNLSAEKINLGTAKKIIEKKISQLQTSLTKSL